MTDADLDILLAPCGATWLGGQKNQIKNIINKLEEEWIERFKRLENENIAYANQNVLLRRCL